MILKVTTGVQCDLLFFGLNLAAALVPSSNSVRLRAVPFVTLSCRALISTKGLQVEKGRPASTEPFCRWCCRTEQELHLGAPDNTFEPYIRYYKSIVQFIQVLSLFSAIIIYSMVCWAVPNKRYGCCKKLKPISVQKLDFTSIENLRGHFSTCVCPKRSWAAYNQSGLFFAHATTTKDLIEVVITHLHKLRLKKQDGFVGGAAEIKLGKAVFDLEYCLYKCMKSWNLCLCLHITATVGVFKSISEGALGHRHSKGG